MTEYDNTNRGVLFKNDKGDNPNRPDYTGDINFNGVDMRLSAWLKESQRGTKFLSLSVSEKQAPQVSATPDASGMKTLSADLGDDEIPF
jgi:uncharacterized protein (DUF736 family)